MTDFSNIQKLSQVKNKVEYEMFELPWHPKLFLNPATEDNKGYFNALIKKMTATNLAKKRMGQTIRPEMVSENRKQDRELYAKYVVVGWENMVDVNNQPVEFSEQNCLDFLTALPNDMFDDLRNFASNLSNFRDDVVYDSEELEKN